MGKIFKLLIACLCAIGWTCTPYPLNTVDKKNALEMREQPSINWRPSIDASMWEGKRSRKPIAIYIHINGCPFCNEFGKKSLSDLEVIELINDEFIPIWMNAEYNAENILSMGVTVFPTVVILTPDGVQISRLEGYFSPDKLKHSLEEISEYIQDLEQKSYGKRQGLRIGIRSGTYRL